MVQAVSSAISALQAVGKKMGVAADNIANSITSGFKKSRASSVDIVNGKNQYTETGESGDALTGVPGSNGLGRIVPQALEGSNVDLVEEIINMTILRRSYQANLKVIQTEDEMKGDVLDIIF